MKRQYSFDARQRFPVAPGTLWQFIADPENLAAITPASMNFKIIKIPPGPFAENSIIEYRINPLPGWRVRWVTVITCVEGGVRFVDEQKSGPYAFWRHEHVLVPIQGGVEMRDHVRYRIPYGVAGELIHFLFIRYRLRFIFRYRASQLASIFGTWNR